MMGNPSEATLKEAVSNNAVENIPFDGTAVTNSRQIFGPALEDLRGKTTRKRPDRVVAEHISIPRGVANRLKYLTMLPRTLQVARDLNVLLSLILMDDQSPMQTIRSKLLIPEHLPTGTG